MTPERLREVLSYNPWTGEFRWKVQLGRRVSIGDVAGQITEQGCIRITIEGRHYYAHRLAWLYMKGEWPKRLINHRNRKPSDNRWPNLREATNSEILARAKRRRRMSRGVDRMLDGSGFRARIGVANKKIVIGHYRTEEQARDAYRITASKVFGQFASLDH
jgi:hypothetical protein